MEALTSELDVQLKLLMFTQGKTKGIVEKANTEGIERHRDALRAIVKRIESVKTQIEQAKLESGVQVDELPNWSAGVEAQQATVDEEITYLSQALVEIKYKASLEAKKFEEELVERGRSNNYSSSAHSQNRSWNLRRWKKRGKVTWVKLRRRPLQ